MLKGGDRISCARAEVFSDKREGDGDSLEPASSESSETHKVCADEFTQPFILKK